MKPGARRQPVLTAILVIAAVCTVLGVTWRKVVRDHVFPRNFGVVEQGVLYRAARLTPRMMEMLREEYGVRTIIDLGVYDHNPEKNEAAQRHAEALGIERYEFWLEGDGTGNPNAYVAALRIMANPANHPVLVHCAGGSERTSSFVMLYHKAFHNRPFVETYPEMTAHKHRPSRNPRLMAYLADTGEVILGTFERGGFIAGFPVFDMKPAASRYVLAATDDEDPATIGGTKSPAMAPAPATPLPNTPDS